MKRGLQFGLAICLCVSVAGLVRLLRVQLLHAASDSFKEYTLTKTERSESRNPHPVGRVVLQARRSDGSRVTAEFPAGSESPSRRFLYLVPERARVQVDDILRMKTTLYEENKDSVAPRPPAYDPQCGLSRLLPQAKPSLLGEDVVLGFKTVMIRTEHHAPDGNIFLNTVWKAPDLDCVELMLSEDRKDSTAGKITGHFEMKVTKVTTGSPDARLFEVPMDYFEKSPSQLHHAQLSRLRDPVPAMPETMRLRLEREDRRYYDNHRAAGVP